MKVPEQFKLKNTIKYPTSLLIGGLNKFSLEIASSLIEQGGYTVIVDHVSKDNLDQLYNFEPNSLISLVDYSSLPFLEEDLRRLDYIFYFNHQITEYYKKISTQDFLSFSNYLDTTLSLGSKFNAKVLLTSSIKANQVSQSDSNLFSDLEVEASPTHIYTELEMHRYAEGLVLEYQEKIDLDTRILRLGEIIGDGIDFSFKTPFKDLILQGAKGNDLTLAEDGLSNEWFIHLLDASYAVIKAQFSQGTKGKIFSAAYDTPITHLSIAYKIQELSEKNSEIKFLNNSNKPADLKIYRPAKSLSDIGWMPRINFEKSVQESLAYAKIFLSENSLKRIRNKSKASLSDKLKVFLNIADDEPSSEDSKDQAELKKHKLRLASSELKSRRSARKKGVLERFQDSFWSFITFLSRFFSVFRNKSPLEISFMFIGAVGVVVIYLLFLAPIIFLGLNYYQSYNSVDNNTSLIQNKNYTQLNIRAQENIERLEANLNLIDRYSDITEILTLEGSSSDLRSITEYYLLYTEGLENISEALSPLQQYLENFENNTQLRTGTDSLLSAVTPGADFSTQLIATDENVDLAEVGLERIIQADREIQSANPSDLPSFLSRRFEEVKNEIVNLRSELTTVTTEVLLPELFGGKGQRTHLLVIQDNSRLTPAGGQIAAFGLITLNRGSITDIIVLPFNQAVFEGVEIPNGLASNINDYVFTDLEDDEVSVSNLSQIYNKQILFSSLDELIQNKYGVDPDGKILINLDGLQQLIDIEEIETVDISGSLITGSNLLSTLNEFASGIQSNNQRNEILAELMSKVLFNIFENPDDSYSELIEWVQTSYSNSTLNLQFDESEIQSVIDKSIPISQDATSFVNVSVNTEQLTDSTNRFIDTNLALDTQIDSDLSITQELTVDVSSSDVGKDVVVCIPLNIAFSSIEVENIPDVRVKIKSSGDQRCIVSKLVDENSVTVTWKEQSLILVENLTNYSILVGKVPGSRTTLDHRVSLEEGLIFTAIKPDLPFTDQTVIYNLPLLQNSVFSFEITSQ